MPQAAAVSFRWNPKLVIRNYLQTNGFIIVCLLVGKLLNQESPKWSVPVMLGFVLCINAFLLVVNVVEPPLQSVEIDPGTGQVTVSRWLRRPRIFALASLHSGFLESTVKGRKKETWVLSHHAHMVAKVTPDIDGWLRKDLVRLDACFRNEPAS
ncbi:hypothetical protein [Hymenobacter lucidus]|uniref:PH domain-containing protein n=1 Tax=Hymenobacter lucidus TaxID=2880930 RepID=A0ABS8AUX4_9BACT|nr:hypothetical protein [Hymenobacter lucidus]MCB2410040.1 hypothetical protein [Hymenobacter lucidus]